MQKPVADEAGGFKLDFTKVVAKYNSTANNMKGKFSINVAAQKKKDNQKDKKKQEKKNEDNDLDLIIEKLRNDMKNSNKTVKDLSTKLEKQKNLNREMKQKIVKLNENLKMVNTKIETLESQIKKVGGELKSNSFVSNYLNQNNSSSFVIETEENQVCNTESGIGATGLGNLYLNTENPNHGYNTIEYDNK
jgi:chromosome segregation ATPase